MKKIEIKGKRNIDKLENKKPIRKDMINSNIAKEVLTYEKQVEAVNLMYLDETGENSKLLRKGIEKKLDSYKNQDKKNKIYDEKWFVEIDYVLELLVRSKLKCYYCMQNCELIYFNVLEKKQWTLDRLDNNYGHNKNNVVISCLECNLKRGNLNSDRFKLGKQLKINKCL